MSAGYPAVYRNDKGERCIVPNPQSGPIGFYRDKEYVVSAEGEIVLAGELAASKSEDRAEDKAEDLGKESAPESNPLAGFLGQE